MAQFRDGHMDPYSGWYRVPWDYGEVGWSRDVDAAARTARRVTESISRELASLELTSSASSNRLSLVKGRCDELPLDVGWFPKDGSLGRLSVLRGLRHLQPQVRAACLADATEAALTHVSTQSDCATVVGKPCRRFGAAQFECNWIGPWKSARDRKTRVRLQGRILDDGYGR